MRINPNHFIWWCLKLYLVLIIGMSPLLYKGEELLVLLFLVTEYPWASLMEQHMKEEQIVELVVCSSLTQIWNAKSKWMEEKPLTLGMSFLPYGCWYGWLNFFKFHNYRSEVIQKLSLIGSLTRDACRFLLRAMIVKDKRDCCWFLAGGLSKYLSRI